jgi:cobalt-zinc-cadmium resistance protein CzcA
MLYYQLLYLNQNKKQLQILDTTYSDFVKAAALRYQTGETNLMEKTTAEARLGQLRVLVLQNESDIKNAYNSLKSLLNTKEDFVVTDPVNFEPLVASITMDTALIANNPSLKLLYQNIVIAEKNRKMEVSQMLPDLSFGYFNQSLTGIQTIDGQEVYYDRSMRFTGFNAGISIPLSIFSSSAKIKALNYQKEALQKEAENGRQLLQMQLQNAFQQYMQAQSQYNYYTTSALSNSETVINTAKLGYASGSISYIEYLQSLQTVTEIQLGYLQAINQVNQSILTINYLINK